MFKVVLNLQAKASEVELLKAWLNKNLPETQAYEGCVSIEALEHEESKNRIVLVGSWQSRAKWEAYIKWREDRGDFKVLAPMLEEEPEFQCYRQFGEWKSAI